MITQLMEAREERQLARMRTGLSKLDLLVLDELGCVPASLIVTTNLPFEQGRG